MRVIVEKTNDWSTLSRVIDVWGPYKTREEAERARRDRHMTFVLRGDLGTPQTTTVEVKGCLL